MALSNRFGKWFSNRRSPLLSRQKAARRDKKTKPLVELLEDRTVPTTLAVGLFNTGVDNTGAVLADGAADPHYTLTQSADPGVAVPAGAVVTNQTNPPFSVWLADDALAKWVSPTANQNAPGSPGAGNVPGDYVYRTSFTFPTGYDPTAAAISGNWAADDNGADIQINGISTGNTAAHSNTLAPFTINSGFVTGTNTLAFLVHNGQIAPNNNTPNPTGLRVEDVTFTDTVILINGSGNNDQLIVNATNSNSGSFQLFTNGQLVDSGNFAGITKFTFNGMAGVDTFTINNPGGGLFAPSGGIFYNAGGDAGDNLQDFGGSATSGSYTPNGTLPAHSGTLSHTNGAVTQTITFTGVTPMQDTVAETNFTINGTAAAEHLNIVDGPVIAGQQSTEVNSTPDNTIEATDVANKTALTINGIAGVDTITINNPTPAAGLTHLIVNGGTDAGDTLNVLTTPAAVTTNWVGHANATVNVTKAGSVQGILGPLNLENVVGDNTIVMDDSADATGRTVTLSALGTNPDDSQGNTDVYGKIAGLAPGDINYEYDDSSSVLINAGSGNDVFNVNSTLTGTPGATTINGNGGNDTFNIAGSGLGTAGDNTFNGNGGNDVFNLNIATTITANSLTINGNDPAADSANRDVLHVNDTSGAARTLNFHYLTQASGDVDVTGFGTMVQVRTMETITSTNTANVDNVTVTGTPGQDEITVAPLSLTSAVVFLGTEAKGGGWENDPGNAPFLSTLNGVAGGSFGPDLYVQNVDPATKLTVGGGNAVPGNDQLYVDATSEQSLIDPVALAAGYDPFGFGPGVLIPGSGAGNAFDTINVNNGVSGANAVTIVNNAFGPLLGVQMASAADFQQTTPPAGEANEAGLTVNAGDEAAVAAGSAVADNIFATISPNYYLRVNGGNPPLVVAGPGSGFPTGTPLGDQLNVTFAGDINVFSDNNPTPNVTVQDSTVPNSGITYSSIERFVATPGTGVVNIIGDNNDPNVDQNDVFKVIGEALPTVNSSTPPVATNDFSLQIGGDKTVPGGPVDLSPKIYFTGVHRLNAYGGSVFNGTTNDFAHPEGFPGGPATGTGLDTLDVTPYANNTPAGWGIETFYYEANVANDGDLLVFNGAPGVANAIAIKPSASRYGQVVDNNASTNTPIAVVNYLLNTNIIVNGLTGGNQGNTDTLTLLGTNPDTASTPPPPAPPTVPAPSGNDSFTANFAAAGTAADPMVVATDANNAAPLYTLQNFTGFNTINVNMLGGTDVFNLTSGRLDGSLTVNVDGGLPSGNGLVAQPNTVAVNGTAAAVNIFEVTPGTTNDSGHVSVLKGGAFGFTNVNFSNTQNVNVTGGGATDVLIVDGTQGNDVFQLTGTTVGSGVIRVNSGPAINFTGIGPLGSAIAFNGKGGNDSFVINQPPGWLLPTININGNGADTVSVNGASGADAFTYIPQGANAATLTDALGASTTTYNLAGVGTLSIDGVDTTGNTLGFAVMATDAYFITPGSETGSGKVTITRSGGNLLPLSYRHIQSVAPAGGIAVVTAPAGGSVNVDATGVVTVRDHSGIIQNVLDFSANTGVKLIINALAGHVAVTIAETAMGGTTFSGGITVNGGNTSTNGDQVTVNATSSGNTILDFLANTITGIVSAPISLLGIGQLTVNGTAGVADTFTLLNYGAPTNLTQVTLNGADVAGTDNDKIAITTVASPSTINYTPLSGSKATITRSEGGPTINVTSFNNTDGNLTLERGGNVLAVNFIGSTARDFITATHITGTTGGVHLVDNIGGSIGPKWVPIDVARATTLNTLAVQGGLGDDTFTVDNSNGPVALAGGTFFDGGPGTNLLILTGTTTAVADTYTPGSQLGAGSDLQIYGNAATQEVSFANLAPVIDLVPGPLVVTGTNANNAISYSQGPNSGQGIVGGATTGQVAVDGFEPIEFANKTTLTINSLNGTDTVSLNHPTNPTGLTGITVNGGDLSAGDTLIVNGQPGFNNIGYFPTTQGAGSVTGAQVVPVTFTGQGGVTINGQGGGDGLTYVSPANGGAGSALVYTPGAVTDSGTITGKQNSALGPVLTPLTFSNLGDQSTAAIAFATANAGRTDTLNIEGTTASDVFFVSGAAGGGAGGVTVAKAQPGIPSFVTLSMFTASVNVLELDGNGGSDTFTVTQGPLPFANTIMDGGNNTAGNTVNLNNFPGTAFNTVVNLADPTINAPNPNTTITGFGGTVTLIGIGQANINAGAVAGNTVTVNGTTQPDAITVTPTGANAVTLTSAGLPTTFSFGGITAGAGGFVVDGQGGSNKVTVNGTSANDSIAVVRGANDTVQVNALQTVTVVNTDTQSLVVATGNGIDTTIVSGAGGPILSVLGGQSPASDALTVNNTAGSGNTTVTPGNTNDSGTVTNADGIIKFAGTTVVNVNDNVASTSDILTVNGTNGNDAITTARLGAANIVWVNAQAVVTFSGFNQLTLQGRFGNDTTTVSPTGMTFVGANPQINVTDVTLGASTLQVNGSTGSDLIGYDPTGPAAGFVTENGAVARVVFSNVPTVSINGQGGSDQLAYITPANGNVGTDLTYTPGLLQDSGTITGFEPGFATTALPILTFANIGTNAVIFSTANPLVGGIVPRTDHLNVLDVNPGVGDVFAVNPLSGGTVTINRANPNGASVTDVLVAQSVNTLELDGLGGNDTFTLNGAGTGAGLPFTNLIVNDGATANIFNAVGAVAVNLGDPVTGSNTTVTGFGGTITLIGVTTANINATDAGAVNQPVNVKGTPENDSLSVTPTGPNAATVQAYQGGTAQNAQGGTLASQVPVGPTLNFTGVSGATGGFTINGGAGSDQLFVVGTQGADTIDVNDAASGTNAVKVNALLVVAYNGAMAHVEIDALAGSDTINIQPAPITTFLVDGGDPIGVKPGDTLNLIHPPAAAFAIFPGPTSDSGGMNTAGFQTVSWIHIETINNANVPGGPGGPGGPPLILGTNGNDEITVIARDSSYNPAAPGVPNPLLDGVQDFTVSVNGGPDMLFIDTPFLFIDSLSGNDDIVVREPAPNGAVWNVQVYVAAGPPASGANRLGDNIELETPGTQTVTYSPNEPLSAIPPVPGVTFIAPNAGGGQFNDNTTASTVTATEFLFPLFYRSSPGGAENFVYAGEAGNDNLVYNTPANANVGSSLTYAPGATPDAGTITGALIGGAALTPLTFSGLGSNGNNITFTTANTVRADHLIVQDLPGGVGDVFTVAPSAGAALGGVGFVQIAHAVPNNTLVTVGLLTPGVSVLELDGLGGSDTFNVTGSATGINNVLPWTSLIINDGATVNLTGAVGPVTVFEGDNTPNSPNPNTVITGYGAPVVLINVDTANLDANGNTLTATGTTQNDNIVYTPTGATAGTFYDDIGSGNNLVPNTVFNIANVAGNFLVFNDPGGNANQVTLRGTAARDLFEINQGSGIAQVLANNVTALLPVQLGISVEILNAVGLGGINTFQVIPAAGVLGQAQDNLLVNVDGGTGGQSNALVIAAVFGNAAGGANGTLPANTFVVVNKSQVLNAGAIRVFQSAVANPDVNYKNIQVLAPNVSNTINGQGLNPNLLVMGPDTYGPNFTQGTSAFLGAGSTLQIQNASIFPNSAEFPGVPANQDWYRVIAQTTGTLDLQVYFRTFNPALLPGGGFLNIEVRDVNGNLVGSSTGAFGASNANPNPNSLLNGARVRIPAVAGQSYFLHVFGANGTAVNAYNATIIDTAPPVPYNVELSRSILTVAVTNGGTGYTSPPTVTFIGGGGTGATGTAYINGAGQVIAITVSGATGYTSPPTVTITGGGGNGAMATASLTDAGALPPNAPNSDSGRSQFDNVTKINTPTIYLRLADGIFLNDLPGNGTPSTNPTIGVIPILPSPNATTPGFRVAVFDGNNTQTPVGFATQVGAAFPGLYQFTFTTALADGLHHLIGAVQMIDPSGTPTPNQTGFGDRSTISLDVTVDTVPPPVFFGTNTNNTNGLDAASDTGVQGDPNQSLTLHDRDTSDTTPTFYGTAEANAIIRVYAISNAGTAATNPNFNQPVLIGQTVATPFDGTNAFPNGRWSVQSNVNLNDPMFFTFDGTRTIQVTAEDLAGNVSALQTMLVFLDTQGPQIGNPAGVGGNPIQITGNPGFNLFGIKGPNGTNPGQSNAAQGPTPLVNSLTINVIDNPNRDTVNFPFVANQFGEADNGGNVVAIAKDLAMQPGTYIVRGDHVGVVTIASVTVTNDPPVNGQPATAHIVINFATPLPDDHYTLTIDKQNIVDLAGNPLTGFSNFGQPIGTPTAPSGGAPGTLVAGFTVNSRPHIATYVDTVVNEDINGDGVWNPNNNTGASNNDIAFNFGLFTDTLFAGNFAPAGQLGNGFDKLGAYGKVNGKFRWLLDTVGNGTATTSVISGLQINGLPIAGPFNPNLVNANGFVTSEIGVFDGFGNWYLDYNHTNNLDGNSLVIHDGLRGYPVVGSFDGANHIEFATYQPDTRTWQFDLNPLTSPGLSGTISWGFPSVQARPVAADMNADGVTDIGLFVPGTLNPATGATTQGQWFFLVSTTPTPGAGSLGALNHAFTPAPFGTDLSYNFGDNLTSPLVGHWDPPGSAAADPGPTVTVLLGATSFTDVSVTGSVQLVYPNTSAGLVSRYQDARDMYWAGLANKNGTMDAEIWRMVGGAWTELASHTVPDARADLEFDTVGNTLTLFLDGQREVVATDSALTSGVTGTYITGGSILSNVASSTPATTPAGALSTPAQSLLSQLQTANGFYSSGNYYVGFLGLDEKWFQDRNNLWYVITPDGQISKWNGGSSHTALANGLVDMRVWDDPTLLFQAQVTLSPGTQSQLSSLRQTYGFRYTGNYSTGYLGLNYKWFQDRNNQWWALTPTGQLQQWISGRNFQTAVATLDMTVYDNPNHLFQATVANELSELQHDFGFTAPSNNNYYTAYLGLNYKWFQSRTNQWYALTPTGNLVMWNGGSSFSTVSTVGTAVYATPTQLFSATATLSQQVQTQLHPLQANYNFRSTGSYYQGYLGLNYKWFQDSSKHWWVLTSGGQLQQWIGGSIFTAVVATVDPLAFDDPTLLFGA